MTATTRIIPSGGYNNIGVEYLSPVVEGNKIRICDEADGSDPYIAFNPTLGIIEVDGIGEFTAGAGVTIDSVLLKDGGVRLANNKALTARDSGNTTDLEILKLDTDEKLVFNNTVVDAATLTSLGAAAVGANGDITSLTACIDFLPVNTAASIGAYEFDVSNVFFPSDDNQRALGKSDKRFASIKVLDIDSVASDMAIGPSVAAKKISFRASGSVQLTLDTSGNLVPVSNNTKSLGIAGTAFAEVHSGKFYPITRQDYTITGTPTVTYPLRALTISNIAADLPTVTNVVNYLLSYIGTLTGDLQTIGLIQ